MSDVSSFQPGFNGQINNLIYQLRNAQNHISKIVQFLDTSIDSYEQIETQLRKDSGRIGRSTSWNTEYNQFSHSLNLKNQSKFNMNDKLTIAGAVTGTASFTLMHKYRSFEKGNIDAGLHMNVGYANVYGRCKGVLYQNQAINPSLNIEAEAKATLGTVNAKVGYTSKYFGAEADGTVDVGVAKATAKAVISKEEISLKASYGVAAVSGKAHGRVSLFGFHLDTTVEGEMLAFGGGAEFSKGKKYVEIGGKLSLFAGLGFKIRLSRD